MDVEEVYKTAGIKRISKEAENLQTKVSQERSKIIKLKVAQDAAYWDLKEKLKQAESNNEKLQQNMVEVQMQHETLSGQYQEELRLRPDTLNKVTCTREICDVLENYSERLKDTLSRCRADQARLSEAYQRSGRLVRDMNTKQAEDKERNRCLVASYEEKVKMLSDHQNQLMLLFTSSKQQADITVSDLNSRLATALARIEELVASHKELDNKLAESLHIIEKKDETIANLHAQMKQMMHEFNRQAADARATLTANQQEIKELKEENLTLKKALENQDQFTKSICEQKNILQEKIAELEHEILAVRSSYDEMKAKFEEASTLTQTLQNDITNLHEEKQTLLQKAQEKQQIISELEGDVKKLKANEIILEKENRNATMELNKETSRRLVELETMAKLNEELHSKVAQLEATFNAYRDTSQKKNDELMSVIETKNTELDSKADVIKKLMSDLTRLEEARQRDRKEIEMQRDAVRERENKMTNTIRHLETLVRDKDGELAVQTAKIMETRNEKERLQKKIQEMQKAVDNVQKELAQSSSAPRAQLAVRPQPQLDDNAVAFPPPDIEASQPRRPATPSVQPGPVHRAARRSAERRAHDVVYNLFSESSCESDMLDMAEVNRRFEAMARGEPLPPAPLAALVCRGPKRRRSTTNNNQTSRSPVKPELKNEIKNKERKFFKAKKPK